ncbi:hypothetical protein HWV62_24071 [Athelia sp. TMB]|nr:hypothetical protein HWV62_24071 [Athelia sp. TMB]
MGTAGKKEEPLRIRLLVPFVCFLAVVGAISIMILGQISYIAKFDKQYAWLVTLELSMFLFIDIVNTSALCAHLRIARTGYHTTDSMLNKLFIWTLETGIFTSLAALLMLVFSLALPNTTLWIGITTFHCKLYSNSLMASLNARESLRNTVGANRTSNFGQITTDNGTNSRRQLQISVIQTCTQVGDIDLEMVPPKDDEKRSDSDSDLGRSDRDTYAV